ncbi:hypothetical protein VTN96DRAFT_2626 [Rasamsonia emersonii]
MEVVGGVASLAQLTVLAVQTYKVAAQLTRTYRDAPHELSRVVDRLKILRCELDLLSYLEEQAAAGDELPLLPAEAAALEQALQSADAVIRRIYKSLDNLGSAKMNLKSRMSWALKDKERVEGHLANLQQVDASLGNVLQLVNIRLSFHSWKMVTSLRQGATASDEKETCPVPPGRTVADILDRNPQFWNAFWGSWRSPESLWLTWLGLHVIVTTYGNALHKTINITARIGPYRFLGMRSLCLHLGIRYFSLGGLGLSLLGGALMFKNVVPDTAEIITSSKRGDVQAVRALLDTCRASPHDVTPSNYGPMQYAIESGSLELVQLLCARGADVNTPFGSYETSPLEWAFCYRHIEIARFLISRGARLDYVSSRGWTPVFELFWPSKEDQPSPEFLHLLCANSFADFDVQDSSGWTCLHRAAAYGTAADVRELLRVGASPLITTHSLGWTPVFCAARFCNTATLAELARHLQPSFIYSTDARGWTLLHVAVDAGDFDTMYLVLQLGADPHQTAKIDGEWVTPTELARRGGPKVFQMYVDALEETGFDIYGVEDDADEKGEIYWAAEG